MCIGERIGGFALETIKLKKGPFEILLKIQSKNHFWEIADNWTDQIPIRIEKYLDDF